MWPDKANTGMACSPANKIYVILCLSFAATRVLYTTMERTSFTNVRLVERVQRSMTRYICNFSADIYKERVIKLNILPLTMRRKRNDLIFFGKCLRRIYEINVKNYVTFSNSIDRCTRSSRDEGFFMKVPFCKSFRKSYFNRVIYIWNSLP